ncbi:MAG: diguanylate cyclase domain-containing protein [Pseudomonadota bacterium]
MKKRLNSHWALNSVPILYLLTIVIFILLSASNSYAQKVVDDERKVDPAIEQRLDDYLSLSPDSELESKEVLQRITAQMNSDTPILSYVRGKAYLAAEYFYEDDFETAYEILEQLSQRANTAGAVDAQAEVVAHKIDFLAMEGKRGEAFLLVPKLERLLEQTGSARIRYYGHNLLASIYSDWERFDVAMSNLIKAQTALSQIDSQLNVGRRLYLASQMAGMQLSIEHWDEAIATVDKHLDDAAESGFDGLAYDLWFTKYYAQAGKQDYEQALASLSKAYQLAKELDLADQQAVILNNFADAFIKLEQFEQAKTKLEQAQQLAEELEFTEMQATLDFNLGFLQVKEGDSLGIKKMENVIEEFRQTLPKLELEMLLGELAEAYGLLGRYQQQAEVLNEQIRLKEEILEASQQQNIADLQAVYKSRDKAQQIDLLEQQNQLKEQVIKNNRQQQLIWFFGLLAVVASSLLLFVLYRKSKHTNQLLNQANDTLADQSLHDPLTGLWNRRALQESMNTRHGIDETTPDALILMDIDHFKKVNDKFGHAAGDEVLIEISRRLENICRDKDSLIRWGGEEFLFYLVDIDINGLKHFVERALEAVAAEPITAKNKAIQVTATLGFIQLPFDGLDEKQVDWERALQIADMALYKGKQEGRNRACGAVRLKVDYETARQAFQEDMSTMLENDWIELQTLPGPRK